jgi:hypothetical protein
MPRDLGCGGVGGDESRGGTSTLSSPPPHFPTDSLDYWCQQAKTATSTGEIVKMRSNGAFLSTVFGTAALFWGKVVKFG